MQILGNLYIILTGVNKFSIDSVIEIQGDLEKREDLGSVFY